MLTLNTNLIPIPLGISNGYGKNLLFDKDEILVDQEKYKQNKENLLYLNFEKKYQYSNKK